METFFGSCFKIAKLGEVKIEEFILSRYDYGGFKYIYNKDLDDFIEFLNIAFEKVEEEKLWDYYVAKSTLADLPSFEKILSERKEKQEVQQTSWEEVEDISNKAYEAFKK